MSLESGFVFDMLNGWAKPMALPVDEKMALLADPDQRRELNDLAQGPGPMRGIAKWHKLHDRRDRSPTTTRQYQGRTIGEIADAEGRETFDVLCDIALADDLRTGLYQPVVGDDEATWQKRVEVWRDERTLVGGTDAGAHLDLLATFNATTAMLGKACREMKLLPFEEAISYITDAPAQLYGLKDRGRLDDRLPRRRRRGRPGHRGGPADRDPPRPARRLVAPLRRGRRHRPRARERHRDRRPRPAHRRPPGPGDALGAGHVGHRHRVAPAAASGRWSWATTRTATPA